MIVISVDLPAALANGKQPHCYFKRELALNGALHCDYETIIKVLNDLFQGVPHEVNIKITFK